jgi:uncharacterized membrane protein
MMWWDGNDYSGGGWWWPGVLVMCVFMIVCMVMMARMMMGHGMHSHGMPSFPPDESFGPGLASPERKLADRLAGGEIDIEQYERLLDALGRTRGSPDESNKPVNSSRT